MLGSFGLSSRKTVEALRITHRRPRLSRLSASVDEAVNTGCDKIPGQEPQRDRSERLSRKFEGGKKMEPPVGVEPTNLPITNRTLYQLS